MIEKKKKISSKRRRREGRLKPLITWGRGGGAESSKKERAEIERIIKGRREGRKKATGEGKRYRRFFFAAQADGYG